MVKRSWEDRKKQCHIQALFVIFCPNFNNFVAFDRKKGKKPSKKVLVTEAILLTMVKFRAKGLFLEKAYCLRTRIDPQQEEEYQLRTNCYWKV